MPHIFENKNFISFLYFYMPLSLKFVHFWNFQRQNSIPFFFWQLFSITFHKPVPDATEDVKKDIEAVKSKLSRNTVAHALQFLCQLLSLPPGAFDVHASMAAQANIMTMLPRFLSRTQIILLRQTFRTICWLGNLFW